MLRLLLRLIGVTYVVTTREEAAIFILQRDVRLIYRPLIVEINREESTCR